MCINKFRNPLINPRISAFAIISFGFFDEIARNILQGRSMALKKDQIIHKATLPTNDFKIYFCNLIASNTDNFISKIKHTLFHNGQDSHIINKSTDSSISHKHFDNKVQDF